jgi:hypothetical protein
MPAAVGRNHQQVRGVDPREMKPLYDGVLRLGEQVMSRRGREAEADKAGPRREIEPRLI